MSFKNIDELRKQLLRLHLIELPQLEECLSQLGQKKRHPDGLIRVLEQKHLLTPYQADKLRAGESDGLVLGDYKLLYRNASGSFARVFRAVSIEDGSMIGLKVLRKRWAFDSEAVAHFQREAQLCMQLEHKNIVPIYDVKSDGDYHYFTMEFIEGGNLREFLNIRKVVEPIEATRCVLDMSTGLDYALSKGISHRDLKLTNVLMSIDGVAKLVDFGLAGSATGRGASGSEIAQRALEYATLERGSRAPKHDRRTDLYFLGAIYYELLTGVSPYPSTRDREQRKQLSRYKHIQPIRSLNPDIPEFIALIVEHLMRFDPKERYQTPAEVITDLRPSIAGLEKSPPRKRNSTQHGKAPTSSMPTVMCIESRINHQNILREYLTKHGFRVLMMSDLQRGLSRLETDAPDCIVLMSESIGRQAIDGYQKATRAGLNSSLVSILVLPNDQADWKRTLKDSDTSRVLVQPITLQDLRREIESAFDRRHEDS